MAHTKNFAAVIQHELAADPVLAEKVREERFNALVAQKVYELRTESGLTQKELADRIGTQQSVISRIEDDDYDGHSLGLLRRIAEATGKILHVEFCEPEDYDVTLVQEFEVPWETSQYPRIWQPSIIEERNENVCAMTDWGSYPNALHGTKIAAAR